MKSRLFISIAAMLASAAPLAGQSISPQCSVVSTQDACQKAIDVFQYLAPQLGQVIAGGNATLGVGGTMGGLGHIYISARANVISADIPRVDQVTPSVLGAHADNYPTQSQIAGVPTADASIGIFRGIPLGVTNVGGIDALVSATYLPSFTASGLSVHAPNGSLKFGGGARLGIVQESFLFPGVSVTYLRRSLPTADLQANNGSDSLHVSGVNISTESWRVVASKNFFFLGLAAGAGTDKYTSSGSASAYVAPRAGLLTSGQSVGPITLNQTLTRPTYFLDASLNFPIVHLIGEVGETGSAKVSTYNTFQGSAAGASRVFGAVGVRLGL